MFLTNIQVSIGIALAKITINCLHFDFVNFLEHAFSHYKIIQNIISAEKEKEAGLSLDTEDTENELKVNEENDTGSQKQHTEL